MRRFRDSHGFTGFYRFFTGFSPVNSGGDRDPGVLSKWTFVFGAGHARGEVAELRSRGVPSAFTALDVPSMAGSENDQAKKSFWTDSIHDRERRFLVQDGLDGGGGWGPPSTLLWRDPCVRSELGRVAYRRGKVSLLLFLDTGVATSLVWRGAPTHHLGPGLSVQVNFHFRSRPCEGRGRRTPLKGGAFSPRSPRRSLHGRLRKRPDQKVVLDRLDSR